MYVDKLNKNEHLNVYFIHPKSVENSIYVFLFPP